MACSAAQEWCFGHFLALLGLLTSIHNLCWWFQLGSPMQCWAGLGIFSEVPLEWHAGISVALFWEGVGALELKTCVGAYWDVH